MPVKRIEAKKIFAYCKGLLAQLSQPSNYDLWKQAFDKLQSERKVNDLSRV